MSTMNLIDINKNYFVIDSNCLEQIETHLYGNVVSKRGIFTNDEIASLENNDFNDQDGTYVYVKKTSKKIIIKQDWHGKFGLYLYKHGHNFYISNSFYFLVKYLSNKKIHLTTNVDYVRYMYVAGMCSANHNRTMINEITLLPRNCYIEIDINNKKIEIIEFKQKRRFIQLDSKKAIEIIDNWYYKWKSFIENLCNKTTNVIDEISGGVDSRITFMLLNNAKINHQCIDYFSMNTKNRQTDFKNASAVAKECGVKLNNRTHQRSRLTISDVINVHTYGKMYCHNYNSSSYHIAPYLQFVFDGYFGENLRGFYLTEMTEQDFLDAIKIRSKGLNNDLYKSAFKLCAESVNFIKHKFKPKNDRELFIELYEETRARHHFGKLSVERFLKNRINISPLGDKNLSFIKLFNENCDDSLLLVTLLFVRFCPQLLDLPFNGVKKIDINSKLRIEAERINKKYPFVYREHPMNKDFIIPSKLYKPEYVAPTSNLWGIERQIKYEDILNQVYLSEFSRKIISKKLGKIVYEFNKKNIDQHQSIHSLLPLIGFCLLEKTINSNESNYDASDYYAEILKSGIKIKQ